MHLGDHLGGVEEHEQCVQRERHILQWRVMLECLGGVHTHRDDTDDGTGPQQGVHPLQEEDKRENRDKLFAVQLFVYSALFLKLYFKGNT